MQKVSSGQNRRALITGASEGIGRVFALRLAQEGYQLTLVARNGDRLDSLVKELHGEGHVKILADLSSADGIATVVNELSKNNSYRLLVNNAGFGQLGGFVTIPFARYREMITLNIEAVVALSHAFLSRAKKGDAIIQVSSTLAFLPMPAQAVYAATKAFVTSFSESLWDQCRKEGIQVMNLCPGSTKTLFPLRAGGTRESIPEWITETPEEVVECALKALHSRWTGPTVVSGWKNRSAVFFTRLVSRARLVRIMGSVRQ